MTSLMPRSLWTLALAALLALGALFVTGPTPASACTGSPLFDARIWSCGVQISEGVTEIEWNRGPTNLAEAATVEDLVPSDGSGDGPQSLEIWVERSTGNFDGWVRGQASGLTVLEPGVTYYFAADEDLSWAVPKAPAPPASSPPPGPAPAPSGEAGSSVFADAQVVSL